MFNKFKTSNPVALISYLTDVYGAVFLKRDKWLTDKEKLVFICLTLAYNEGIRNYLHGRAKKILKEGANIQRTSDIRIYLVALAEKGWLTWNKKNKTFEVRDTFKNINLDKFSVNFKIDVVHEVS